MCMNLSPAPTSTQAPKPVTNPIPVADPAAAPVGEGAAKRAALTIKDRKRRTRDAIDEQTR